MVIRNIAYQAVLLGHTVRFTTASDMLSDLAAQGYRVACALRQLNGRRAALARASVSTTRSRTSGGELADKAHSHHVLRRTLTAFP
jgi:hypothetical protein